MAISAYNRGLQLSRPGVPVIGVGFTSSLASTYAKRGEHRFYLSTREKNRLWASKVTLSKGLRTREEEDKICSHFVLKAIADACKVDATYTSEFKESEMPEESEEFFTEDQELQQLIDGEICMKVYPFEADISQTNFERKIILSGSFNPLHEGHVKLLEVASSVVGNGVPCFELSAVNADKPPLTVAQIKDRVQQFKKVGKNVIISNQPLFYKKAELFPGSAFVIGADTAVRLIDPKYYKGDRQLMVETLTGCKKTGCVFVVGARTIDGTLKVLQDFDIPKELVDMFMPIPMEAFCMDISSTEIRRKLGS